MPREIIRALIEAATWAPNHRLTQPWRFTVVRGNALRRLGEIWGAASANTVDEPNREAVRQGEAKKLARAPVITVASVRTDSDPTMAEEDMNATAAAVQNLLLAAYDYGLSAAWKTGRITQCLEVKSYLGLDSTDRIVAFVYLGAEAAELGQVRQRDVDAVITWMDDEPDAAGVA